MILSVTGPRPIRLGGYYPSVLRKLDDFARGQIWKERNGTSWASDLTAQTSSLVLDSPESLFVPVSVLVAAKAPALTVLTGMALGWDQAVARACVFWNVPFVAVVPFTGQESRWPLSSQRAYRSLISSACRVVVVSEGGFSADKMMKRNRWMVDNSDRLLALLGRWETGGTWNCVKYANKVGRECRNCWDEWETFR